MVKKKRKMMGTKKNCCVLETELKLEKVTIIVRGSWSRWWVVHRATLSQIDFGGGCANGNWASRIISVLEDDRWPFTKPTEKWKATQCGKRSVESVLMLNAATLHEMKEGKNEVWLCWYWRECGYGWWSMTEWWKDHFGCVDNKQWIKSRKQVVWQTTANTA